MFFWICSLVHRAGLKKKKNLSYEGIRHIWGLEKRQFPSIWKNWSVVFHRISRWFFVQGSTVWSTQRPQIKDSWKKSVHVAEFEECTTSKEHFWLTSQIRRLLKNSFTALHGQGAGVFLEILPRPCMGKELIPFRICAHSVNETSWTSRIFFTALHE